MPVFERHSSTAEEFLHDLSPRGEVFSWVNRPHEFLFRGHADSRYSLVPSALRLGTRGVLAGRPFEVVEGMSNDRQAILEWRLLREFFWKADEGGLQLPEDSQLTREALKLRPSGPVGWPRRELLSITALAQHNGLPTRLLDWSRSGRVAAYFAASEAAAWAKSHRPLPVGAARLAVWAFHAFSLELQERLAEVTSDDGARVVLVTAPRSSNQNLHAQKGVFTLVARALINPADPVDRTPLNLLSEVITPRLRLYHFTLPIGEAPKLLRLLAHEGVNAASLFPGYSGVVQAMREEELWDISVSSYSFGGKTPDLFAAGRGNGSDT